MSKKVNKIQLDLTQSMQHRNEESHRGKRNQWQGRRHTAGPSGSLLHHVTQVANDPKLSESSHTWYGKHT